MFNERGEIEPGYLGLTLVFVWDSALGKGLISVFHGLLGGIGGVFKLAGGLGAGLSLCGV